MTGRHRAPETDTDPFEELLATAFKYWRIAVLGVVVLGVIAVIVVTATAASAHPAPTPPHVGLITTGAEAGVTAGTSS